MFHFKKKFFYGRLLNSNNISYEKRGTGIMVIELDSQFENRKEIEANFSDIMNLIGNLFEGTLRDSNFRTVPNFYGVFVALYHMNYGIPNLNVERHIITSKDYPKVRNCFDDINCVFEMEEVPKEYFDFLKSTKDATTDVPARTTRCEFISQRLLEVLE